MEPSKEYYPIREWAEDDRPREKLLLKGRQSLSDAELIAILMGSGSRNESAVDLAKRILKESSDNLMELSKLSVQDLMKFKGVGEAKAISIIAALELGKRRRGAEALERKKISSSKDVFEFFSSIVGDLTYETFYILLLNRANSIIRGVQISEGGISGTVADPKKIFKLALDHNATSIILCHNHPSGNVKPSQDDIALTKKIKKAGETMDISVLDHIILGDEKYYSFADEGMM
jgi:DNA repair protein RadC